MINAVVDGRGCCGRERVKKLKSKLSEQINEACVDVALKRMRDNYRTQVAAHSRKSMELYHNW